MKPSTSPSSSNSVAPAYLLMAGILAFGLGSAYMVLRPDSAGSPEPVRAVQQTVAAAAPSQVAEPGAASAASAPVAEALPGAASAAAPNSGSAPVEPRAAEPAAKPVKPAPRASAPARKAVTPPPAEAEPVAAERTKVTRPKAPAGDNVPLASERDIPKAEAPSAERPDKAEKADKLAKPEADKPARPVKPDEAESRGAVKPLTAPALVPIPAEPKVVAATDERAYVRLDEKRTVIVKKGDTVQGLGVYLGLDGAKAKFESGTLPITTN